MKIRITDPTHSVLVQEELFRLGYSWVSGKGLLNRDIKYIYAYNDYSFGYSKDDQFFQESPLDEYVLTSSGFWPGKTPTIVEQKEKPPLGLRPAEFPVRKRITEILEAMLRYNKAGLQIPNEWVDEFYNRLEEVNTNAIK
jgi:hypothetical protein